MKNYDYGVIGNCKSAALVSRQGSIDWCCLPDFDSPFVFGKLLDEKKGGFFTIEVAPSYTITQSYMENTNILLTRFKNKEDSFEIQDFMPRYRTIGKFSYYYCPPDIIRLFRLKSGHPSFRILYRPTLHYGKYKVKTQVEEDYIKSYTIEGKYESLYLYTNLDRHKVIGGKKIVLTRDAYFLLSYNQKIVSPTQEDIYLEAQRTKVYWLEWTSLIHKHSRYHREIIRSALVLKLMTYQKTGAILASITTSLPEIIGEERNWDYRFCWIRDASMTISVFIELRQFDTVLNFIHYILSLISYKEESIQIMYGIRGQKNLEEERLDHLSGYENSRPVRIGNAAYHQKQNDIFGILLDAVFKSLPYLQGRLDMLENIWTLVRSLINNVRAQWRHPDKGIWEYRNADQHFTFSKVLCWVAVDRGIRIANYFGKKQYIRSWNSLRDEIKEDILKRGWNQKIGAFTQFYGSDDLDASNLLMEEYGFLPATALHYRQTVEKTFEKLCVDSLMFRYRSEDDFGLPNNSFTACTFWMVNSLYRIGERKRAMGIFENALSHANHLGLFSEDIDLHSHRLLGNFPQAYSHLSLISAAINLSRDESLPEEDRLGNRFKEGY